MFNGVGSKLKVRVLDSLEIFSNQKKEIKIMVMTNFKKRWPPPPPIPTPMILFYITIFLLPLGGPQMVNKEIELN